MRAAAAVVAAVVLAGCASNGATSHGGRTPEQVVRLYVAAIARDDLDAANALMARQRADCPPERSSNVQIAWPAAPASGEWATASTVRVGRHWTVQLVTTDGDTRSSGSPLAVVRVGGRYWVC